MPDVQAGLLISGINAEVMPGQWEFQIGPVGAPDVGDEVMIARWLLHRLGEQFGIVCTFNPKPVQGDWNGALSRPATRILLALPLLDVLLGLHLPGRAIFYHVQLPTSSPTSAAEKGST